MAEITPFQNSILPQQPGNVGTDSYIQAARRVGPLLRESGEQIGQGVEAVAKVGKDFLQQREDVEANQEISGAHVALAKQQINDLDYLSKNPTADLDTYAQHLAGFHDQFVGGMQTQKAREWAENAFGQYQGGMLEKAALEQATARGAAATTNLTTTVNTFADTVRQNPTLLDTNIGLLQHSISGAVDTAGLPPDKAAEVKARYAIEGPRELVIAAARAQIDAGNMAGAQQIMASHAQYLDTAHTDTISNYARVKQDAAVRDQLLNLNLQDHIEKEQDKAASRAAWNHITFDPATGRAVPDSPDIINQVIHSPFASSATKNLFRDIATEAATGTKQVANQQAAQSIQQRMLLPDNDPQKLSSDTDIGNASVGAGLSASQTVGLIKLGHDYADNPQTKQLEENTNNIAAQVLQPKLSATGATEYNNFIAWKEQTIKTNEASGISRAQSLDPNSDHYILGKPDATSGVPSKIQEFRFNGDNAMDNVRGAPLHTASEIAAVNAVSAAQQITSLVSHGQYEAANRLLKSSGVTDIDTRNGNWCAALVRAALPPDLRENTNNLAVSFKTWGAPVDPQEMRIGDVFYVGPSGRGDTGHVGYLTGNVHSTANGTEVQVVSSHLQGSSLNGGGVEWRNTAGMTIRRAQPSVAQSMQPGALSRWFHSWNNPGERGTAEPAAVAPLPPPNE